MSNINDVAREAKVSITTVSRYLNDSYPVKEKTRKTIEAAIKKLNFKPNAIARGLVNKKTDTIGIIVPFITNLFFSEVIEGIANQCKLKGYNIIIANSEGKGAEEKKIIENYIARQVDGIVIVTPNIESLPVSYYEEINGTVPLLIVNKHFQNDRIAFVYNNEEDGAFKATEYLMSLGHRNILFISGARNSYSSMVKIEGFNKALKAGKLIEGDAAEGDVLESNYTSESTFDLVKKNMDRIKKYSAIFCANDIMAIGAIKAIRSEGFLVPKDFSVIGYDNISIGALYEPGITTVSQNIGSLGETSGRTILGLVEKKEVPRIQVLATELVTRDSCAELKEWKTFNNTNQIRGGKLL